MHPNIAAEEAHERAQVFGWLEHLGVVWCEE